MRTALLLVAACGSSSAPKPDAPVDKAAACAATFGTGLTNAFGRLDGTVLAIVEPGNMTCAMPNGTHVVLQLSVNGDAYRMVANVLSTSSDPHVWLGEVDAPLAGAPWSEGWHPGAQLDYAQTLHVAKSAFTQADETAAVARLEELAIGVKISVYATSENSPSSAHLIHRNATNADGAIVLSPDTAPRYLLTAFPEQTF